MPIRRNMSHPIHIFRYGFKVGQYPWYCVAICLLFSGLCGIGLINYTAENNAFRLWIPTDSSFVHNYQWLLENYPPNIRYNNIILAKDGQDILEPKVLHLLSQIQFGIENEIFAKPYNKSWNDICKKVPILSEPPPLPKFIEIGRAHV